MIGVVANGAEHSTIVEFFELFKTPWEFWRPGSRYDVLLCSNSMVPENDARLLLLYGSQRASVRASAAESRRSLFADTISFLFAVSECRFMETAFCSTARATKSSFTNGTNSAAAISTASGAQAGGPPRL